MLVQPRAEQAARWRIDLEAAVGERVLQRDDEVFDLTDLDDSLDSELTIFGVGADVGESVKCSSAACSPFR